MDNNDVYCSRCNVLTVHPEYAWEQHAVHPTERKGSKDSGTKVREVAQDAENCASFLSETNPTCAQHEETWSELWNMSLLSREKYYNSFLCHLSLLDPIAVAPRDYAYVPSKITHRMLRAPLDTADCAIASFSAYMYIVRAMKYTLARIFIVVVAVVSHHHHRRRRCCREFSRAIVTQSRRHVWLIGRLHEKKWFPVVPHGRANRIQYSVNGY